MFCLQVPRQREFKNNMTLINDTLNGLIKQAQQFEGTEDLEELQNRDYSKVKVSLFLFSYGQSVTDVVFFCLTGAWEGGSTPRHSTQSTALDSTFTDRRVPSAGHS